MATAAVAPTSGTDEVDLTLTLRNLLTELVEVRDWRTLGVHLAVPKDELSKINARFDGERGRCKKRVLDWWLTNDPQPSWEKLAQALEKMGPHEELVQWIWRKFVTSPPVEPNPFMKMWWRKFAELPMKVKVPHAVAVGGRKIFVASQGEELSQIFQYHTDKCEWSVVPHTPREMWSFSLGQLSGQLLTVGGYRNMRGKPTVGNNVYSFNDESRKWKELSPLPTARASACVISTSSAVIVAGGYILHAQELERLGKISRTEGLDSDTDDDSDDEREAGMFSAAVEVYSAETAQWSVADSLPSPSYRTSGVVVADTCYLMAMIFEERGRSIVLHAPVASLIRKAVPRTKKSKSARASQSDSSATVWKHLGILPFGVIGFTAANVGGILFAHGGADLYSEVGESEEGDIDEDDGFSTVLMHSYSPSKECWIRVPSSGDMPKIKMDVLSFTLAAYSAVELAGKGLLTVGFDGDKALIYLGSPV